MNGANSTLRVFVQPALPYLACLAPLTLYQALYVNAFYPITEGWFSEYAHLIRSGEVPYRDFSLLLTPLYPVQLAAFQALFGEGLFSLHVLGIFVTCAIAIALFDLLGHFFNPWICAFAAAVGTIYYQSGNAFIDYDFTQFVTLYLLTATALLVRSIKAPPVSGSDPGALRLCAFSGFFLGLAVLIKQSNGGAASLAVGLASIVIALVLYRPRTVLSRAAALTGGFCVPLAATSLWLLATGAFHPFLVDIFVAAFHAKGGFSVFTWIGYYLSFIRWFGREAVTYLLELLGAMILVSVTLEWFAAVRSRRPIDRAQLVDALRRIIGLERSARPGRALLASSAALGLLCVLIIAIRHAACAKCGVTQPVDTITHYFISVWSPIFYLVGFASALALLLTFRHSDTAQFLMIAALGIGLTFGNGMSGGISEISTFLGITMFLAFLIDIGLPYLFPALLPVALALFFCGRLVENKFSAPYTWWQVTTPPVGGTACADTGGILRGLCIPPRDYASIVSIEDAILASSSPGDPIYVYPHMPIFYLLTNRPPFDGAVVSWFDATSDQLADDVSRRLRTNPPPVIVMAEIPEEVLVAHEHLFRGGKPLSQRKILASIANLRSGGLLQLIDRIMNLNGLTIDVYRSVHR